MTGLMFMRFLEIWGYLKMNDIHEICVGDIVKHFKRQYVEDKNSNLYLYKIIGTATDTTNEQDVVVYQSLENGKLYTRELNEFLSYVDKNKYPDIDQIYRFERFDGDDT